MKTIQNELPPRFRNWLSLYGGIKRDIVIHEAKDLRYQDGDTVYEFTVDFLKAKCFDELTFSLSKIHERLRPHTPAEIVMLQIASILEGK
jgi:hypothetical protein